jgi:hypothetical protein
MLGFFTDPYPDELLYSVCARFGDRMKFSNVALAGQRFFGIRGGPAVVDLPSHLNHLIKVLPPNHNHTADQLINHCTLVPIYAPFMPSKRAHRLREDMKQEVGINHAHGRVGIRNSHIKTPDWLRFCPICEREDKERFGERYWHRVHQIPGIEVCPIHSVFLEMSSAPWQDTRNPGSFFSAEKAIGFMSPRHLDISDRHHRILLKVARDAAWLLNWHGHNSDTKFLHKRYYNLLLKRGLAYYNGRIKTNELSKGVVDFFSQEFLKKIQSEVTNLKLGWVYRLVHTNTLEVAQQPLRHLLLITFLGYTAEEFFTDFDEFKPFGDKPWPCLNRASDHYGESIVAECRLTDNLSKKKSGKPMGTFRCIECGFIYTRIGPDTSEKDRFRADSIQTYGSMWGKALRKHWEDTALSIAEIGRRLGVSVLTVERHAIRHRLLMNTLSSRQVSEKTIQRYSSFRRSREEMLGQYREEWIALRNVNPKASRKELNVMASFLYLWLKKNDAEWLESHLPAPRYKASRLPHVDWKNVDVDLSKAVIRSASRIKRLEGKPVRASLAEIIREIGNRTYLEQRLHKLPLTAKALDIHLESLEAFAIRKVEWAAYCYLQEARIPTRPQLIGRAVVANKTGRTLPVQSTIDAAMERLSKELR